jgi:hypothetical protein
LNLLEQNPAISTMKLTAVVFLSLFSLVACTAPAPTSSARQAMGGELPAQWPQSPGLAKNWGPAKGPSLHLNGHQQMEYLKPDGSGSVSIVYEGKNPRFPEIRDFNGMRASDGQMMILGQRVDFYGSGNEEPEISTQPMQLTSPEGETGWFTFSFSSKEHLKGKNIPVFTW